MYLDNIFFKKKKKYFFFFFFLKNIYKMIKRFGQIPYNKYLGELWLWMIFLEWIYFSIKKINNY